ncbi:MAG: GNAT family N-acetyltransferase [Dehalococcoidales bacterium]|nr:GNAT family N-acetyltransferase [Dehalococcoidales bacterium]
MKIREAKIDDAPHLAAVSVATSRTTYSGIFPEEYLNGLSVDTLTPMWEKRLEQTDRPVFFLTVESDAGDIIGYASGLPERTGNRLYTGEIGEIYLLKEYQRRGIGRILMATVVERLMQQGHRSVLVWAVSTNPYTAFYKKLGGQVVDTKEVERAGVIIPETAYGWRNLDIFTRML